MGANGKEAGGRPRPEGSGGAVACVACVGPACDGGAGGTLQPMVGPSGKVARGPRGRPRPAGSGGGGACVACAGGACDWKARGAPRPVVGAGGKGARGPASDVCGMGRPVGGGRACVACASKARVACASGGNALCGRSPRPGGVEGAGTWSWNMDWGLGCGKVSACTGAMRPPARHGPPGARTWDEDPGMPPNPGTAAKPADSLAPSPPLSPAPPVRCVWGQNSPVRLEAAGGPAHRGAAGKPLPTPRGSATLRGRSRAARLEVAAETQSVGAGGGGAGKAGEEGPVGPWRRTPGRGLMEGGPPPPPRTPVGPTGEGGAATLGDSFATLAAEVGPHPPSSQSPPRARARAASASGLDGWWP